MRKAKISPSMMCADFLRLEEDLEAMASAGVEWLHIDIMDGRYVPNFTLGPDYCRALAKWGKIPLDIHLMIEDVDHHAPLFFGFSGACVAFHPETVYHPVRTLQFIRAGGAKPGIDIAPSFTLEQAKPLLPYVDLVCVMTVNPGYSGQKLIPEAMEKIPALRDWREREGLDFEIEVDGNVSWENIPRMVKAGAEVLIAGTSSVFGKGKDLLEGMRRMREVAAEAAQ